MEMDEVAGTGVNDAKLPHKPVVYPPTDGPLCELCSSVDNSFFDVKCAGCLSLLQDEATTVSELFAILRQWIPQTQQNIMIIIEQILTAGGHVSDRDGLTDMTLLHYACKSGARGMGSVDEACQAVSWLLRQGADPYIRCRWTNMAAIHYAAYFDVAPVVAILLAATKGIDVDSPCSEFEGGTPLHIAAQNLALDTAKVLLANGAYPFAVDVNDKQPLDLVPDPCSFEPDSEVGQLAEQMKTLLETAEPTDDCIQLPTSSTPESRQLEVSEALEAAGLKIGDRVFVGGVKAGVLRFCGRTVFAPGLWAGVELDEPAGKNNGSIDGILYFRCPPNYGIFAPLNKITTFGSLSSPAGRGSLQKLDHGKIPVSHVTAKVDTGLKSLRENSAAENILPGDHVLVAGKRAGIVHFVGNTEFAPGLWFGIELDKPVGKNDGSVNGRRYFTCKPNFGVFAPSSRVQKLTLHYMRQHPSGESTASQLNLVHVGKKSSLRSSNAVRGSLTSLPGSASGEIKLVEGLSVFCNGEMGVIRYIGHVDFAEGLWLGVSLKTPKGKHDGCVQGRRYFTCRPGHGVLVRPSRVSVRGINGAQLRVD